MKERKWLKLEQFSFIGEGPLTCAGDSHLYYQGVCGCNADVKTLVISLDPLILKVIYDRVALNH